MMSVEFLNIPNYNGLYQISKCGIIKRNNKILKQHISRNGYYYTTLYINGKRKTCLTHRLLALTFIPNPENFPVVNHKDCNKQHNSVGNLEWCTQKYNIQHAIKTGVAKYSLNSRGSNNGSSKLTEKDVLSIIELHSSGKHTLKYLGEIYGVSKSTIYNIVKRKSWKHI